MKRKYRLSLSFAALFCITALGFNNCGQPGDIALKAANSTSSSGGDGTGGGGSGDGNNNNDPGGGGSSDPGTVDGGTQLVAKSKDINVHNTNKVDILVVMDNSPSLRYEQQNMATRFNSFIGQLSGLDWQLGIITTDVDNDADLKDGRLISFNSTTKVISSAMSASDQQSLFASTIQRPEIGSTFEQGVKATYRFLERALNGTGINVANKSLMRDDANFAVIVVSDANETPNPTTETRNRPDQLLAFLNASYPNKSYNFHSIVVKSDDSNCKFRKFNFTSILDGKTYTEKNEEYGKAYEYLSKSTDGIIGSVCESDYGSQLASIGDKVRDIVTQLNLDCLPVDGTGDGVVDIEIKDASGALVTGYTVVGKVVHLAAPLPEGKTTVKYFCLQ